MPRLGLDAVLRRERVLTVAGLAGLTLLAWLYLLHLAHDMGAMDMGPAAPMARPWSPRDLVLTFVMWAVMMVAMMVPSAAPMILFFATITRARVEPGRRGARTAVFVAAYLLVWTAFSALATLGQWGLHSAALLSPHALTVTPVAGGALLIAAGVYQLTPLKYACLARCQSPLGFVMRQWREGPGGALVMGLRHGAYCVGCCWSLMALLFVAGVMNLLWVAAIAGFVLVEKVVAAGRAVSWVAGGVLTAWGVWVLARGL